MGQLPAKTLHLEAISLVCSLKRPWLLQKSGSNAKLDSTRSLTRKTSLFTPFLSGVGS